MKGGGKLALATVVVGSVLAVTAISLINGAQRVGKLEPGFPIAWNLTILSAAHPGAEIAKTSRAPFAQVVAIDDHPVSAPEEIQAHIAGRPEGSTVTYRLKKGSDLFTTAFQTRHFTWADYLAVYGTYAVVGVVFSLTGWWTFRRAQARGVASAAAFFVLCQAVGFTLGTAGDVYGPYWFTQVYFTAQCVVLAALLHLAASFPEPIGAGSRWRRAALAGCYLGALALAAALHSTGTDLSLFLPLVYTVYLLLANAIFFYAARLVIALSPPTDAALRVAVRRALAGILLVVFVPGVIFVVYPTLKGSISPILLVGPFILFPLLTGSAVGAAAMAPAGRTMLSSVRTRLSLLFLGAVETSFLIAVAVFWQNNSWAQLLDELALNQRQQAAVARLSAESAQAPSSDRDSLDGLVQTVVEDDLVRQAVSAAQAGDHAAAQESLARLGEHYAGIAAGLHARESWIVRLDAVVLVTLLLIAIAEAIGFMGAVRRWLIEPINRIAVGTSVIATGDLAHRLELDQTDEFSVLGRAVNSMAASLQSIQRRIELSRAARQRATGAARDAERRRLARELHDGILQDLSAVQLRLKSGLSDLSEAQGRATLEALGAITASIRRVVDDLRPPDLRGASLADAIAGHARVLAFGHQIELSLDLSGARAVPDWATRDVYRIAQEAIGNAARHGAPSRLTVSVRQHGHRIVLEIEDDGRGFDQATAPFGSGMHGMRERAAALGGDLHVESRPGGGTTVRLVLPLAATAA